MSKQKAFILHVFITIFFFSSLFCAEKNIIFYITDDQSPTLGCYGDKVAITPHIDALAKDGTVFDFAFATTASCSASRSVVLSGLHNHHNGQYGHTHNYHKFASYHYVSSLSLPRALEQKGYRTVQIGKYHVSPEPVYHFQTYLKHSSRDPVGMANKVNSVFQEKSDKPFFLYIGTSDPHRGGGTNKNVEGKFKPDLFGNLPGKRSRKHTKKMTYDPNKVPVPGFLPDTPECRAELAEYYQSVSRIDQGFGVLIKNLKEAGLYDKTLIVFTADHGIAFAGGKTTVYEAGLRVPYVVRNPYSPKRGNRNSAMISHVDIAPSLLDFADGLDHKLNRPKAWTNPRLTWKDKDYLKSENKGYGKFDRYQGRSWLPILDQENPKGWDVVYGSHTFHEIQMYYPMRSIRDRKYKLIWNIAYQLPYPFATDLWASSTWQAQLEKGKDAKYGQKTVHNYVNRPAFELYDMQKDPHEGNNLASDEKYAEVLEEYKGKLKRFQQKSQDPWVLKWKYE